jgi:DNA-binding transcriptional LysR family regulator
VCEGNTVSLTREGQTVFKRVSKIFREIDETESLLQRISSQKGGELQIGCPETPELHLLQGLIAEFKKSYPDIRIVVNHGRDTAMAKSVEDGRNDLAVIRYKPSNCRLKMKMIGKEELVLIASPSSVHLAGNEVRVNDLAQIPFIALKEGFAVREVVLEYLGKFGISPRVTAECSTIALLKELVRRDNGVAFIEKSAVEEELGQDFFKQVHIAEGSPTIGVAIGYPHPREISPPARAFVRFLQTAKTGGSAGDEINGSEAATRWLS